MFSTSLCSLKRIPTKGRRFSTAINARKPLRFKTLLANTSEGKKALQGTQCLIEFLTKEQAKAFGEAEIFQPILAKDFTGDKKDIHVHYPSTNVPERMIWAGLGPGEKLTQKDLASATTRVAKKLKELKVTDLSFNLQFDNFPGLSEKTILETITKSLIQSNYQFSKYITKKDDLKPEFATVNFTLKALTTDYSFPQLDQIVKRTEAFGEATSLAKDLVNERSSVCNPAWMEQQVLNLFSNSEKYEVQVLHEAELKELGLNLLVAVGQGAALELRSRLVVIKYKGDPSKDIASDPNLVALVGKGVTFDTGGLDIKGNMEGMYMDMAGSAAVCGAMKTLEALQFDQNVIGVLALVENSVGPHSFHKNSIIQSYKGITVEITNTDAEGRLILADALTYSQKHFKPEVVINLATLTGACKAALGEDIAGIWSNDLALQHALVQSGADTQENLWPLPLNAKMVESIKGDKSDLKNWTKGDAGASRAAAFLKAFIEPSVKWSHIDLAGPAMNGPSGFGAQLLLNYLANRRTEKPKLSEKLYFSNQAEK